VYVYLNVTPETGNGVADKIMVEMIIGNTSA